MAENNNISGFAANYLDRVRVMFIEMHTGLLEKRIFLCMNVRSKDLSKDHLFVNPKPYGKFPLFSMKEITAIANVIDGEGVTEENLKLFRDTVETGMIYIQPTDNCPSIGEATRGFSGNAYTNALNIETVFRLKQVLLHLNKTAIKPSLSYMTKCVNVYQEKLQINRAGDLYTTQKVLVANEEFGDEDLVNGDADSKYLFANFFNTSDGVVALLRNEEAGCFESFNLSDVMLCDGMHDFKRASVALYENKSRKR